MNPKHIRWCVQIRSFFLIFLVFQTLFTLRTLRPWSLKQADLHDFLLMDDAPLSVKTAHLPPGLGGSV